MKYNLDNQQFKNKIFKLLDADDRVWTKDHKEIDQIQLLDLLGKYDERLITLLFADHDIKNLFFIEINGFYIFKYENFKFYIEEHKPLDNSFTKFKNRIGLNSSGKFIKDSNDVVLNIPFKDCILEGGQTSDNLYDTFYDYIELSKLTTEPLKINEFQLIGEKHQIMKNNNDKLTVKVSGFSENKEKRKEIFFNEILAKDEIDRLLDNKALINWKKYSLNGEEDIKAIEKDHNGQIKSNLIIKGNNLIALYNLIPQFKKEIKFIYIDPPYNTESDSFVYNDNFKRSTWLVFMKNRFEAAIKLLSEDGVIAVQCSFHQYPYLKVLMDEIFGLKNYKSTFHIQVRHPDRHLVGDKEFNDVIEYILIYSKNSDYKLPKKSIEKTDENYIYDIKIIQSGENITVYDKDGKNPKEIEVFTPDKYEIIKNKPNNTLFKDISVRGSIREKNSSGRFYVSHLETLKDKFPPSTLIKVPNIGDDIYDYRYFYLPRLKGKAGLEVNKNGGYFQGKPTSSNVTLSPYPNFYNFESQYNNVGYEGGIEFRNGKKPEELIKFLIEMFTKEGDRVLDYHLGSGTTAAVAHKLGRKYIGIEQMNYIETITIQRLKNVIHGDNTGISKEITWQGGGEFIYFELAKYNEEAKEIIASAKNTKELIDNFDMLYNKYFLNYNLKVKEFKENIICNNEFQSLELSDQKKIFLSMLDLNQLYINADDALDPIYKIKEQDLKLTAAFFESSDL